MTNSKATRLPKVTPARTHCVAHNRLRCANPAGVKVRSVLHLLAALCLGWALGAPTRADTRDSGDETYQVGEYKLPALIDPTVASEAYTELWAAVYRPRRSGRFPLLVFLHGNHATCGRYDPELGVRIDDRVEYTTTGTCPEGWVPTPNHLGYRYLASTLARNGYVVVSINANRGVNAAPGILGDSGLNLRRGRLVLRHMQQLARWSAGKERTPESLAFSGNRCLTKPAYRRPRISAVAVSGWTD
jgi:hypothetical protein